MTTLTAEIKMARTELGPITSQKKLEAFFKGAGRNPSEGIQSATILNLVCYERHSMLGDRVTFNI